MTTVICVVAVLLILMFYDPLIVSEILVRGG